MPVTVPVNVTPCPKGTSVNVTSYEFPEPEMLTVPPTKDCDSSDAVVLFSAFLQN